MGFDEDAQNLLPSSICPRVITHSRPMPGSEQCNRQLRLPGVGCISSFMYSSAGQLVIEFWLVYEDKSHSQLGMRDDGSSLEGRKQR